MDQTTKSTILKAKTKAPSAVQSPDEFEEEVVGPCETNRKTIKPAVHRLVRYVNIKELLSYDDYSHSLSVYISPIRLLSLRSKAMIGHLQRRTEGLKGTPMSCFPT